MRAAHYRLGMRVLMSLVISLMLALLGGCSLMRDPAQSLLDTSELPMAAPGESFVALSGGACLGPCPVYQIFVFESGRVVFIGKQYTAKLGVIERQTTTAAYYDLKKLLLVRRAFSPRWRFRCVTDHPVFSIGDVHGAHSRTGTLDYGCPGQVDDLEAISAAFIRVADAQALIDKPK